MTLVSSTPATKRPARTPSADRPPEQAFRALVRTFGLLERVMQPYFARFGISASQWAALRVLHRAAGNGLRITELSERLLIRPPSVTGVIDRLERSGLVVRDTADEDQRARRVQLTPRGRRLVDQIVAVHPQRMARVLDGLDNAEQGELHRLLDKLSGHLERLLDSPASDN